MFNPSIAEQIEAARPYFPAPKPMPKDRTRIPSAKDSVFACLPKTNGITTTELCEKVGVNKSTICQCLKVLRAEGRARFIGKLDSYRLWVRA